MSMMNCPECGKEISDKALNCPNCGCPLEKKNQELAETNVQNVQDFIVNIDQQTYNISEMWREVTSIDELRKMITKRSGCNGKVAAQVIRDFKKSKFYKKKKDSTLSVWALLLSFFGCTTVIGLILAIVDLATKKDNSKLHNGSILAIGVFVIWCMIGISYVKDDNKNNEVKEDNKNIITTEASKTKKNEEFELGEVYNDNGFVITLTKANDKEMTFEILNNTEKEYEVYVLPKAINNTMEEFDHAIAEKVSAGKKAEAVVDIRPVENTYDVIKSVSYRFEFYELTGSVVSFREFQSEPVIIKTNMYDNKYEFKGVEAIYVDENISVGCMSISDDYVEISIINDSDKDLELNINNAAINEWTYDVNGDLFAVIYNESLFPHTQKIIKIKYSDFVKEKGLNVEQFEFVLSVSCPDDYEQSYQTEKITFSKE